MIKVLFGFITVLLLSACSTVVISDGKHHMIVGENRVADGCTVRVDNEFDGRVEYTSDTCTIVIDNNEQ